MNTTLAIQLVAAHRGLIGAHEAAADFHTAMASALEYEQLMADYPPGDFDHELAKEKYPVALGQAAEALRRMPAIWTAILTANIGDAK